MSDGLAVVALVQAQQAKELARCNGVLQRYNPATASVVEMQDYAGCVVTVHGSGQPITGAEAVLVKIAILLVFVGMLVGGYFGWRADGWVGCLMFSLFGAAGAALGMFVLALIVAGVGFLFS